MEKGSRKRSSSAGSEKMERELVADRKKWKDIVRQAKAHSGLNCQWKKKHFTYFLSDTKVVAKRPPVLFTFILS